MPAWRIPTIWAETIFGRVVGVTDGDMIKLLTTEKKQIKVRLYGIEAPESKQPFGARAKQSLSDLVFGKEAKLVTVNTDRYGRSVAWVHTRDLNANEEQVRAGMAWWYKSYAKHEKTLRIAQNEARLAKRGLWLDPDPVPPWTWRKEKQSKAPYRKKSLSIYLHSVPVARCELGLRTPQSPPASNE